MTLESLASKLANEIEGELEEQIASDHNLSEDRAKAVAAGLAMFQKTQAEMEDLRGKLRQAMDHAAELETQLAGEKQLNSLLEHQVKSHQIDRDQAVADRAVYEALFIAINGMLHAFNFPEPLVDTNRKEEN